MATGIDDRATATPLSPHAGFRIASNTKTFVAATVLRLAEQGALALDDPIAGRLSAETVDVLRGDGYEPDVITVRELLLHTSGIYDYGQDPAYQAAVGADPTRRWTRLEQVQWAVTHGQPTGEPGQQYGYSDTGYILLGEIIEQASGAPLADTVRTLLDFDGLGLDETYWESLERAPSGIAGRAHQYFGEFDGYALDPSFDLYGAAGLVSTADDLSAFYRALLRGELFSRPETLTTMLDIPAADTAVQAGMGIFRHDLAGTTLLGARGHVGHRRRDLSRHRRDHRGVDRPGPAWPRLRRRRGRRPCPRPDHRRLSKTRRAMSAQYDDRPRRKGNHGASMTRTGRRISTATALRRRKSQDTGRRWIVSVFGDISRTGSWPARRQISPVAVFGDIDLDLRHAAMPDEVTINAIAPFGNVDVLVPADARVDLGGFTLFGSKKVLVAEAPSGQSAPAIRVRGFSLLGSVKVWSP